MKKTTNQPQIDQPPEETQAPNLLPTVTVADLDANGVYWGVTEIARADLAPEHVEVPAECDLTPGAYRWSAAAERFEPLGRGQRMAQPGGVSLEDAVHELAQLAGASGPLPPRLAQWVDQYRNSVGRIGQKG